LFHNVLITLKFFFYKGIKTKFFFKALFERLNEGGWAHSELFLGKSILLQLLGILKFIDKIF